MKVTLWDTKEDKIMNKIVLGRSTFKWQTYFIYFKDGSLRFSIEIGDTQKIDKLVKLLDSLNVKFLREIPKKIRVKLICSGVDFYNIDNRPII